MTELEVWIQSEARGLHRWERAEGWPEDKRVITDFDRGDPVIIDPIPEHSQNCRMFWPIYCTFLEYATDDIAKVYVPPTDEENVWFREGEGKYFIHEGYLTPQ